MENDSNDVSIRTTCMYTTAYIITRTGEYPQLSSVLADRLTFVFIRTKDVADAFTGYSRNEPIPGKQFAENIQVVRGLMFASKTKPIERVQSLLEVMKARRPSAGGVG